MENHEISIQEKRMDTLKSIFDTLLQGQQEENNNLYRKIIADNKIEVRNIEGFNYILVWPYEGFLKGLICEKFGNSFDMRFLFLNNRFIQNYFRTIILKYEGSACSEDKVKTIMESLINYLKNGTPITWNYEAEYTFHLPKKIFTEHQQIIEFFEALKGLHSGKIEKYLQWTLVYDIPLQTKETENNSY